MNTEWNSETQAVYNWIQDDRYLMRNLRKIARIAYDNAIAVKASKVMTKERQAINTVRRMLEDYFEELVEGSNFFDEEAKDLRNINYSNVKWDDLAKWYLDNYTEE